MNYRHVVFILIIFILSAHTVYASVVINEIAWMGTTVSTNDEWIELYNSDSAAVPLDGWTLNATDGSPMINLSGTIPANGYYLAERTDDSTVPGITAGVIYSGSLSNTGETLILKNNTGQVIDTVAMTSGWTAGNSTTKETMQKNGTAWITNNPTPGSQNATTSTGNAVTNPEPSDDPVVPLTPSKQKTEKEEWTDIARKIDPDTNYSVRMIIPDTIVAQAPSLFSSEVMKFGIIKDLTGKFEWSMGDGQAFVFNQSKEFTYTYQQPGRYVIIVNYYSNIFKQKPDSVHKITIDVLAPSISVTRNSINSDITLINNSEGDIDLKDWKLELGGNNFKFLASTVLLKGSSVIIPQTVHRLSNIHSSVISLVTPAGFTIGNIPLKSSSYSTSELANDEDAINAEEKPLFEEPQIVSAQKLVRTQSQGVIIWLIGFIILVILLSTGFYILTNKLKTEETAPEPTL